MIILATLVPNIRSYDPRLGQDYVVKNHSTKASFSSLAHGFYVLEVTGELDWDNYQDMLLACMRETSKSGFFTVVPWRPGAAKLKHALLQQFGKIVEIDNSLIGYFDPSTCLLNRLFAIRNECGGTSSGEWCVGGCSSVFSALHVKNSGWNLTYLMNQAEKIGCVLSLEEMEQSYFMVKAFDELPKIIDVVMSRGSYSSRSAV